MRKDNKITIELNHNVGEQSNISLQDHLHNKNGILVVKYSNTFDEILEYLKADKENYSYEDCLKFVLTLVGNFLLALPFDSAKIQDDLKVLQHKLRSKLYELSAFGPNFNRSLDPDKTPTSYQNGQTKYFVKVCLTAIGYSVSACVGDAKFSADNFL